MSRLSYPAWQGARDSDAEPCNYLNHYACGCGASWSDRWSCACDDECPDCGADVSPEDSDVEDLEEYVDDDAV